MSNVHSVSVLYLQNMQLISNFHMHVIDSLTMGSYVTGYWSYLQWDHMLLDTGLTYNGIICYWTLVLLTMGSYVTGYWSYLQWDHMLLDTGLTYNGIICYWILLLVSILTEVFNC